MTVRVDMDGLPSAVNIAHFPRILWIELCFLEPHPSGRVYSDWKRERWVQMTQRLWGFLCLGVAVAAVGLSGCNSTEPTWGSLTGTVTDAEGTPLAGARVNLGYTLLLGGDTLAVPPLSRNVGPLTIQPDSNAVLTVFDHLGREVWTATGGDTFYWDGKDLDGHYVPDGPYRYTLVVPREEGEQTSERWIVFIQSSLEARALTAVATTGDDGTFEIPYPEIPIWGTYEFTTTNEAGDVTSGEAVFDKTVKIYAFRGDGTLAYGSQSVRVEDRSRPTHVDLVIP